MARRKANRSLSEVVADGDQRSTLEATRDAVAKALELAEPREVASLAKQLAALVKELAELPTGEEQSIVDDLARKRSARRAPAPKTGRRPA
jgi:hypothetical protein